MTNAYSTRIYKEAAARSAGPGQLVLMLFDGAIRFMSAAAQGGEDDDFIRRNERIHNNLTRAQAILTELQATLNLEAGGEFGRTMFRLYGYMQDQLREANRNKDIGPIHIVQRLLEEIRDAWAQMLEQSEPQPALASIAVTC